MGNLKDAATHRTDDVYKKAVQFVSSLKKSGVKVVFGGLSNKAAFAQAVINTNSIHFNPDWIAVACNTISNQQRKAGLPDDAALLQVALGVAKLLHELTHLLTPPIMKWVRMLQGNKNPSAEKTLTQVKLGNKLVVVKVGKGRRKTLTKTEFEDPGYCAEKKLFSDYCTHAPLGSDPETPNFVLRNIWFADETRNGREFKNVVRRVAWLERFVQNAKLTDITAPPKADLKNLKRSQEHRSIPGKSGGGKKRKSEAVQLCHSDNSSNSEGEEEEEEEEGEFVVAPEMAKPTNRRA